MVGTHVPGKHVPKWIAVDAGGLAVLVLRAEYERVARTATLMPDATPLWGAAVRPRDV